MNRLIDISNKKFGRLTPIKTIRLTTNNKRRNYWVCICDCGNTVNIRRENLLKSKYGSCGCYKKENIGKGDTFTRSDKWIFNRYKDNAKTRKLLFNLEFDFFSKIIHSNCYYCNTSPSNGKINLYNGIDRKDNNIGYESNNCVPCCKKCNFLKGSYNYNDFLNTIFLISNNLTDTSIN